MKVSVDLGMHRGTVLELLLRLRSPADPDCCSFCGRNLNRISAGVVDAEVVDDDAESDRKKSVPRLSASQ